MGVTIQRMLRSSAPTLETERLVLRGHTTGDFNECSAMWADPVVVKHIGGTTQPAEKVWTKMLAYLGHWAVMGYGFWVLRDKASGRFVGEAGLADFRREVTPGFDGAPEAGWALAAWAHGRGLATEAMRAVTQWGDANLPDLGRGTRTVCMIDPDHAASIRVAEKLGFRAWTETRYMGAPIRLFERS